jgi:hypothetical protein
MYIPTELEGGGGRVQLLLTLPLEKYGRQSKYKIHNYCIETVYLQLFIFL